jgi:hypothetical protein
MAQDQTAQEANRSERRGAGAETLRGGVEAANEQGIKLGGRWLDYSRFHAVPHPVPGQEVAVEIVRGRFINALTILGGDPDGAPEPPDSMPWEGLDAEAPTPPAPLWHPAARRAERNTEIRRLRLLRTAAAFHAGRAKSTGADVLATARGWETWVVGREPREGGR